MKEVKATMIFVHMYVLFYVSHGSLVMMFASPHAHNSLGHGLNQPYYLHVTCGCSLGILCKGRGTSDLKERITTLMLNASPFVSLLMYVHIAFL